MHLRFSTVSRAPDAVVHLAVTAPLHFRSLVRDPGQALCRRDLNNLEPLDRQVLDGHGCCEACVDLMAAIRLKAPITLPAAAGVTAGDLIQAVARRRAALNPLPPSRATGRRVLPGRPRTKPPRDGIP